MNYNGSDPPRKFETALAQLKDQGISGISIMNHEYGIKKNLSQLSYSVFKKPNCIWLWMEQNCPNYRQRRRGSRAGHPTRKLAKFLNGLYSSTVYKPFKKYWCVESMKALPRGALSRLSFQMTNRATILECQSYRLRYRLRE